MSLVDTSLTVISVAVLTTAAFFVTQNPAEHRVAAEPPPAVLTAPGLLEIDCTPLKGDHKIRCLVSKVTLDIHRVKEERKEFLEAIEEWKKE